MCHILICACLPAAPESGSDTGSSPRPARAAAAAASSLTVGSQGQLLHSGSFRWDDRKRPTQAGATGAGSGSGGDRARRAWMVLDKDQQDLMYFYK